MNLNLIDTHAHIYLDQFRDDQSAVIDRAKQDGVNRILMPNIDLTTVDDMHRLEETFPEYCYAMMGLHPCSVDADYLKQLDGIKGHLEERSYIAVGEIGIDLHWDTTYKKEQIEAFRMQTEWAVAKKLPIVIHSRESLDLILDLLEAWALTDLNGIFHCFGGDLLQAIRIKDLGFLMGIGGVLTFKNSRLREVLPAVGLEQLVLETDAPYLAPTPYRGKRNEPAYVSGVAAALAEALDLDRKEVAEITTKNAENLFFP